MLYPRMLFNLLPMTKTGLMLYQERPCDVDLTLTAFDIDALIDKSDRKLYRQATQPATLRTIFSLLKPSPTVLISFVRGNIHTCFPLFNIRNSKTLILIIVYLNMYNPLIVVLCVFSFFNSSYCTFYALCFIFCVFCVFH